MSKPVELFENGDHVTWAFPREKPYHPNAVELHAYEEQYGIGPFAVYDVKMVATHADIPHPQSFCIRGSDGKTPLGTDGQPLRFNGIWFSRKLSH